MVGAFRLLAVLLADGYKCTPGVSRSQGDGAVGECVLRLILSWAGIGGNCTDKLRSLRGHDNPRGGRSVGPLMFHVKLVSRNRAGHGVRHALGCLTRVLLRRTRARLASA